MRSYTDSWLKYSSTLVLLIAILLSSGCGKDEDHFQTFTDARDGQTYNLVTIGDQVWMAENLNYIPTTGNSWCYENDPSKCDVYGRLYDWNTAMTVVPDGWRIPSNEDWDRLIENLGGPVDVGNKLKQAGSTHWDDPHTEADNSSGFSALGSGYRLQDGTYVDFHEWTCFWSSTPSGPEQAWFRGLKNRKTSLTHGYKDVQFGYSVRCIKD